MKLYTCSHNANDGDVAGRLAAVYVKTSSNNGYLLVCRGAPRETLFLRCDLRYRFTGSIKTSVGSCRRTSTERKIRLIGPSNALHFLMYDTVLHHTPRERPSQSPSLADRRRATQCTRSCVQLQALRSPAGSFLALSRYWQKMAKQIPPQEMNVAGRPATQTEEPTI